MTKPNKQSIITNKNLRYIIILLNLALRLSVRHFALDGRDFDIAESVSKENFDECDRADVFMLNHPYFCVNREYSTYEMHLKVLI